MTSSGRAPLLAGRTLVLLGIVLVALNLRTAVAAISPITSEIRAEVPLTNLMIAVIGTIPPIAFSLSALFGAVAARRIGLERLLVIAIVAMIAGHLLRALAWGFPALLVGSVLALAGAGIGNVLLPPIVKRYFPDRLGVVTSSYVTIMSVGASVPALVAAPLADAGGSSGWRLSLGVWAALVFVSLIPWLGQLAVLRRARAVEADPTVEAPGEVAARLRIWRSSTAWTMALVFALAALNSYVMFAWLPELLVDTAHVTAVAAGALLALFGIMGLPAALIAPVLTTRLRNVGLVIIPGIAAFVLGWLGLLLTPATATWLWVLLIGIGAILFPICLTLINLRSRSHEGSVALSGLTQGVGYGIGALGPLVVGILRSATGGWTAALIMLVAIALLAVIPGLRLSKKTFVEDEAS